MPNPSPRPALVSTKTGVRPAADRLTPLTVSPGLAPARGKLPENGKRGKDGKDDKPVDLVVTLPRSMRKRLTKKAEALGYTPEEATYRLLRSWLDS